LKEFAVETDTETLEVFSTLALPLSGMPGIGHSMENVTDISEPKVTHFEEIAPCIRFLFTLCAFNEKIKLLGRLMIEFL